MFADASFFPPRPNSARSSPRSIRASASGFSRTLASLFPALSYKGRALFHQSEAHLLFFQSSPHSLRKTPECHRERSPFFAPTYHSLLTPVESALTDERRRLA